MPLSHWTCLYYNWSLSTAVKYLTWTLSSFSHCTTLFGLTKKSGEKFSCHNNIKFWHCMSSFCRMQTICTLLWKPLSINNCGNFSIIYLKREAVSTLINSEDCFDLQFAVIDCKVLCKESQWKRHPGKETDVGLRLHIALDGPAETAILHPKTYSCNQQVANVKRKAIMHSHIFPFFSIFLHMELSND